jgi:hypothetical protein
MGDAEFVRVELGAGEYLGQGPYAARVVEMNVGDEDLSDLLRGNASGLQAAQQGLTAGRRPGLEEGPPLLGREQVGGDEPFRITKVEVEEQASLSQFADLGTRHAPPLAVER